MKAAKAFALILIYFLCTAQVRTYGLVPIGKADLTGDGKPEKLYWKALGLSATWNIREDPQKANQRFDLSILVGYGDRIDSVGIIKDCSMPIKTTILNWKRVEGGSIRTVLFVDRSSQKMIWYDGNWRIGNVSGDFWDFLISWLSKNSR